MNSNYSLIEQLQLEMQKAGYDVKAEPQLLQALEQGLLYDDFLVSCDGLFRREYSRDIVKSDVKEDGRRQSILELHLSRSGLYDQLPEGLFFQSSQRASKVMNAIDMASDYKYNKKKEEEIRRFFLPFENDFFLQRMHVEAEEAMLLEGLQSGILNDYFIKFWDLPAAIPKAFVIPLILLLPYAHRIAGNTALTAECLRQLLQEDVQINKKQPKPARATSLGSPSLGDGVLGLDLMCGLQFWEGTPYFDIAIGPLNASQITDYLEGGSRFVLLETFNRFFIPAGIDTVLSVKPAPAALHMVLGEKESPVLGYSSILG
ncbi:MAG: type VI secretion system baseplate subunit TssG [Chitinophagaceae bacterium]